MTSLTSFLRGCYRYLPSLLRPMLPSVGGFAISSAGYFYLTANFGTADIECLQYQVCEKTSLIFQDKREIELEQEAKLKAKYGGLKKPGGGSTLLQKRLQKGVSNGICYRIISLDQYSCKGRQFLG